MSTIIFRDQGRDSIRGGFKNVIISVSYSLVWDRCAIGKKLVISIYTVFRSGVLRFILNPTGRICPWGFRCLLIFMAST